MDDLHSKLIAGLHVAQSEPAAAQCIRAEIALELLDLPRALTAIEACIKADPQGTHPSGVRARALLFRVKDRL